MKPKNFKELEHALYFSVLLLVPLHLTGTYQNIIHGIDKGYGHHFPIQCYIILALYLIILVAADTYMLHTRNFEPAKAMAHYWLLSCVLLAIVYSDITFFPEGMQLAFLLVFSPYCLLIPLYEQFFEGTAYYFLATAIFCVANLLICNKSKIKNSLS